MPTSPDPREVVARGYDQVADGRSSDAVFFWVVAQRLVTVSAADSA